MSMSAIKTFLFLAAGMLLWQPGHAQHIPDWSKGPRGEPNNQGWRLEPRMMKPDGSAPARKVGCLPNVEGADNCDNRIRTLCQSQPAPDYIVAERRLRYSISCKVVLEQAGQRPQAQAPAPLPQSAAESREGISFIQRCALVPLVEQLSDCGCIEKTLRSMPYQPEGSYRPEDQPSKRAAEACAPDQDTLARMLTQHLKGGSYAPQAECMGPRVARAYRAEPVFNREYLARLKGNAYKACIG